MPGFESSGFESSGFVTVDLDIEQVISFLYKDSVAGTSFANDKVEIGNTNVNVKLR